ncbi:carboxymuconolactone decarboxylase family protein [Nocardia sp. NEAU-G5]|uniref:Carboxymuconolactone decarboxylase family protein n=1 Tax=Nocardia albiluteola TaxID=2842303 RepID=A0ABS6B6Q1_9NOCA|nr:carboxymuconolactone decarboxylase family protein [Nocardia albiluteola]MBU3065990.1 carboxymuconolactone decarboxylase family protein [Nocardia albiluteola]
MTTADADLTAENSAAARRARGIAAYARIFDVPEQDVEAAMTARVGPVFAAEAFASAGGPAWSHGALTARDRSVAIITALTAQGVTGDRLDTHLRLASANGIGHEGLTALMTLLANYIGYPHASAAMESVERAARSGLLAADGNPATPPAPRPESDPAPGRPGR